MSPHRLDAARDEVDLIVVGAGIIGAFAAHEAAIRNPKWRIAVLDLGAPGRGATAWSAGADFPLAATPAHRELVNESTSRYRELRNTSLAAFIRPTAMIYVVPAAEVDAFANKAFTGVRVASADQVDQVRAMLPGVRLSMDEQVLTGLQKGAAIDAPGLARGLLLRAVELGRVGVFANQSVADVEYDDTGYRVHTPLATWKTHRMLLATGPWPLPELFAEPLAVGPGAGCKRIAALHARLPVAVGDPLVSFVADDIFALPTSNGHALISFHRDSWGSLPDEMDGRAEPDDIAEGVAALAVRLPTAAQDVVGGRAFVTCTHRTAYPWFSAHPNSLALLL